MIRVQVCAMGPPPIRTGLRRLDDHASWREVCYQLCVDPDQHEDDE